MIEKKLRELMDNYNIKMILFVHPDLGTVQLSEKKTWYIHGRGSNINRESNDIPKLISKLEEKVINEDYEDLLLIISKIKEVL
jgi:ATP-dependent Zn protease